MFRIVVFVVAAVLATAPSFLIALVYLRRKGHSVPAGDTIKTFMEVAPGPAKFGLIALNFINFTLLCGGGMALTALLEAQLQ